MKRVVLAVIAVIGLSGCSGMVWTKPDFDQASFQSDKATCDYQSVAIGEDTGIHFSMASSIAAGLAEGMREARLFGLCMKAQGYVLEPKPKT